MTGLRFFVYGSMCEGLVHFRKIQDFVTVTESASVMATAFRLKVGYPVLLEQASDSIPGQLLHLNTLTTADLLLALLDEFHSYFPDNSKKSLNIRKEIDVTLATGEVVSAFCYFYNPEKLPSTAKRIEGGDWRKVLEREPALPAKLTDRQRSYVSRLGSTTGREIVPIDLGLYRELMNLELIVDKGRRLALSPLGQEVYRYL